MEDCMKKIIAAALLAILFSSCVSVAPVERRTVERIVTVDGATKQEIFLRTLEWFAYTFKSSKDVIDLKDQESGKIIAKGYIDFIYLFTNFGINTLISIEVKDGKARISCVARSLEYVDDGRIGNRDIDSKYELDDVMEKIKNLVDEYSIYITSQDGKADW